MTSHLQVKNLLARVFFDTYLFHYKNDDIMARKPWRLEELQQPFNGTHTLYVGGTAGFETVEDSLQFNLELVHKLIDEPLQLRPRRRRPRIRSAGRCST